jgi:hypothetical protein
VITKKRNLRNGVDWGRKAHCALDFSLIFRMSVLERKNWPVKKLVEPREKCKRNNGFPSSISKSMKFQFNVACY